MDIPAIVQEIVEALEDLGSPERSEQTKYYAPTAQRVIGVSSPDLDRLLRELKARHRDWNERDWLGLCKELVARDIFECQALAFGIISSNRKLLSSLQYEDLAGLGRNLDNWASVDYYSVRIHGVLWRMGVVRDHHIRQLLASDSVWDRRVAVASTIALNLKARGGTGDTPRTLAVCEKVVDERHPMIWKALSWALRELSKRDRDAVYEFIEMYGERMSRQVLREVNHKLEHGTKN
jgi:3-methyladenine DNA glycosylase AlkD